MLKLCEYAQNNSTGIAVNVSCTLVNQPCGMIRFCTEQMCPVMTSAYTRYGCKIKEKMGGAMARKKKQKDMEVIPTLPVVSGQHNEICKVNYIKGKYTSISYLKNGKLVSIFVPGNYQGEVEITYVDELRSSNIKEIRQI